MHDGCGCTMGAKGGPCSKQFSNEEVLFNLNNCLELSSGELISSSWPASRLLLALRQSARNKIEVYNAVSSIS